MTVLTQFLHLFPLLSSLAASAPFPAQTSHGVSLATNVHTVYQYPNGTWVENVAVRQNGNLLVTFTQPAAELHQVDPFHPPNTTEPAATLVHHFNHTQLTGIAELEPDVFAVIGDSTVYRVSFHNGTHHPAIAPIATIATAGLLNGMAHLPSSSLLLISDSELGLVWRLDAATGNYSVHYQHETMAPTTGLGLLLGINGLRYLDGHVCYVNSPRRLFARYPADARTGAVAGEARVIAAGALADDFNVREERGSGPVGYLAGLDDNVVTRVTLDGAEEVAAGGLNSSTVAGATSGAWGRTAVDGDVLYVTTGGGSAAPVNGTFVEGGKIVALTLAE